MSSRRVNSWAAVLGAALLWRCGGPGADAKAPTAPPQQTAGCGAHANYCLPYNFLAGDTCSLCQPGAGKTSRDCPDPGFELITWQVVANADVPTKEALDWNCYPQNGNTSACYLNHQCTPPASHPDSFSMVCENAKTQESAPAPLVCAATRFGAELTIQPQTNVGFWPHREEALAFVPGTAVTVEAIVWLPRGIALEVGLDCGRDPLLGDRQGQSGTRVLGAGRWEVVKQSFTFDAGHPYCSGWGQILDAAEFPPYDGEGKGGVAYLGSYSVSGVLASP